MCKFEEFSSNILKDILNLIILIYLSHIGIEFEEILIFKNYDKLLK